MNKVGDYFSYYLMTFFQVDKEVRISQILHTLRGKKTPSMYYLTEINQWHHGFSIAKRMEEKDIKIIVQAAYQEKWLRKKEKGFQLTPLGKEIVDEYFESHYYPEFVHSFNNIDVYDAFWERLQLFSQVFSEYSYHNMNYTAVIKEPKHQEKIRMLFQASQGNKTEVLKKWTKEQYFIFENLTEEKANLLVNSLTGHQRIGKTRSQLAAEFAMKKDEFNFYLRDSLAEVIQLIHHYPNKLVITRQLLKATQEDYYFSMSESTYRTFKMLEKGKKISEIARLRRIKENTVKEHLLEIAFVLDEFPIKAFVPSEFYQSLSKKFQENPFYSYREAVRELEKVEFYHYRLVELERMRKD